MSVGQDGEFSFPELMGMTEARYDGLSNSELAAMVDDIRKSNAPAALNPVIDAVNTLGGAFVEADDAIRDGLTKLGVHWQGEGANAATDMLTKFNGFAGDAQTGLGAVKKGLEAHRDGFVFLSGGLPEASELRKYSQEPGKSPVGVDPAKAKAEADRLHSWTVDQLNQYSATVKKALKSLENDRPMVPQQLHMVLGSRPAPPATATLGGTGGGLAGPERSDSGASSPGSNTQSGHDGSLKPQNSVSHSTGPVHHSPVHHTTAPVHHDNTAPAASHPAVMTPPAPQTAPPAPVPPATPIPAVSITNQSTPVSQPNPQDRAGQNPAQENAVRQDPNQENPGPENSAEENPARQGLDQQNPTNQDANQQTPNPQDPGQQVPRDGSDSASNPLPVNNANGLAAPDPNNVPAPNPGSNLGGSQPDGGSAQLVAGGSPATPVPQPLAGNAGSADPLAAGNQTGVGQQPNAVINPSSEVTTPSSAPATHGQVGMVPPVMPMGGVSGGQDTYRQSIFRNVHNGFDAEEAKPAKEKRSGGKSSVSEVDEDESYTHPVRRGDGTHDDLFEDQRNVISDVIGGKDSLGSS
jgi:hypothetical protein